MSPWTSRSHHGRPIRPRWRILRVWCRRWYHPYLADKPKAKRYSTTKRFHATEDLNLEVINRSKIHKHPGAKRKGEKNLTPTQQQPRPLQPQEERIKMGQGDNPCRGRWTGGQKNGTGKGVAVGRNDSGQNGTKWDASFPRKLVEKF